MVSSAMLTDPLASPDGRSMPSISLPAENPEDFIRYLEVHNGTKGRSAWLEMPWDEKTARPFLASISQHPTHRHDPPEKAHRDFYRLLAAQYAMGVRLEDRTFKNAVMSRFTKASNHLMTDSNSP
jgi:hypothetical protein